MFQRRSPTTRIFLPGKIHVVINCIHVQSPDQLIISQFADKSSLRREVMN